MSPPLMPKKRLTDLPAGSLDGSTVLVRVDFNVPMKDGEVADSTRIRRTVPTLQRLVSDRARIILLSHLGRPKGEPDPELSLQPVADALARLMECDVGFSPETVGDAVAARVKSLEDGQILLLENTRFLPGETSNDPELARAMAKLGSVFVNDAFGTAHRAHASTEGVARVIRERGGEAVAGLLMERELRFLGEALDDPERPFVAILGGAKISGKIDVIRAMLPRVDRLLVGGAMANTFFRALGLETGRSLVEEDRVDMARELLQEAGDRLLLPVDVIVAATIEPDADTRVKNRDELDADDRIGDVGPDTRALFAEEVRGAATAVWNGPMGVFEVDPFREGTLALAHALARASDEGAITVVGGGDSASAAESAGVADRLTHISTGGGASIELMAGQSLPGVEALSDRNGG